MSEPQQPTTKDCLNALKTLEKKVAQLQSENAVLAKSESDLRTDLSQTQKKYNDLVSKEASVSSESIVAPTTAYDTIQKLTTQNMDLMSQLQRQCSTEKVQDILDTSELHNAIQQYKTIIAQKNREIDQLRENCSHDALLKKKNQVDTLLKRAMAVNQSYVVEIGSLQSKLKNMKLEGDIETTQAQAVSGDQDVHGSASTSSLFDTSGMEKELDDVKNENESLKQQLGAMRQDNKDLQLKLNDVEATSDKLKQDNERLIGQIDSMSNDTDTQLTKYQLKIFQDDFNSERKEKQALVQQKEEINGENNRLKQQLHELEKELNKQGRFDAAKNQRPFNNRPPAASLPYNPNLHHDWPGQQKSLVTQENNPHHPFPHPAGGRPPRDNPYQRQPSQPDPTRRIGFTAHQTETNVPTSVPLSAPIRASFQPFAYPTQRPNPQQMPYQMPFDHSVGYLQADNSSEQPEGVTEASLKTLPDQEPR